MGNVVQTNPDFSWKLEGNSIPWCISIAFTAVAAAHMNKCSPWTRSKVVTVWRSMSPYCNNFTGLAECFKWKCIWYKLQVSINMMQGSSCCWLGSGLLYLTLSPEIMPEWINHNQGWLPFGSDISSLCVWMCICVCVYRCVFATFNLRYPFWC